jgi:pilus assembly protein CpaE
VVDTSTDLGSPATLAEFAASLYDVVLLDTAGPYGEWNLAIARLCDELVLVCSNDLPSLHAAQRAMTYLEANGTARDRIRLVVNRYSKAAGLHSSRIGEAIGAPVTQLIPTDAESVAKSLMDGKPIPASTAFGKGLSALAAQLVKVDAPAPKTREKPSRGLLSSLFSRS